MPMIKNETKIDLKFIQRKEKDNKTSKTILIMNIRDSIIKAGAILILQIISTKITQINIRIKLNIWKIILMNYKIKNTNESNI